VFPPLAAPAVRLIDPRGYVRANMVVEVAADDASRARGLAGRAAMRPGTGLLFLWPQDVRVSFTVARMRFAIDLIWLARDGRVLGAARDLLPGSPLAVAAPAPFRAALETHAGLVRAWGVGPGWRVEPA
jgi:hypothetical protein